MGSDPRVYLMRIPRIYYPDSLAVHTTIQLTDGAAAHLIQVLRLSMGAEILLFNGQGGEYTANIVEINKRKVKAYIAEFSPREVESPIKIHLAQAISRGEKMDYTLQKAVELGVTYITPLMTERSQFKLTDERLDKKIAHWQSVVISACEQCGRNQIPDVAYPIAFNQWLSQNHSGLKLVLDPAAKIPLSHYVNHNSEITLLVGSEGGLSDQEINSAKEGGFNPIILGPRILRTETAALVAISAIQTLWGDFIILK